MSNLDLYCDFIIRVPKGIRLIYAKTTTIHLYLPTNPNMNKVALQMSMELLMRQEKVEENGLYLVDKVGAVHKMLGQSRAALREEVKIKSGCSDWYQRKKTKQAKKKKAKVDNGLVSKSVSEMAQQLKVERDKAEIREKIELLSQSAIKHRNKNMTNVRVKVGF